MSLEPTNASASEPVFASRPPERGPMPVVPWAIAGVVVLIAIALMIFAGHRKPAPPANQLQALDPYAASLVFSGLQMSESTSLSGGKSTFIDGHVHNTGTKTVTGATVQVIFANDEALSPQVETLPLTLIRTHQPYIDTQPVGDAPLAPGDDREFRLIFENIGGNWNQQLPEIHLVHASLR